MKQLAIYFFCFVYSVTVLAQQPSSIFISNERVHDFGEILEKEGKISHTFYFSNRGNKPIVINDVSAWCGCTTSSYTKKPIFPKKKGAVVVTYNPYNRPGSFSKEIIVHTESGKSYSRIWVKGNVIPYLHPVTEDYPYKFGSGLYLGSKILAFGLVRKGEKKTMVLRYANDTDSLMTLAFKMEPNDSNLRSPGSMTLKSKERSKLIFSYTAPNDCFFDRLIKVYPIVNGKCLKNPILVTFSKL